MTDKQKPYWIFDSSENIFRSSTNIVQNTLPPSVYSCDHDKYGYFVRKKELCYDTYIDLPENDTKKVINEIEKFWDLKEEFEKYGFLHKRGMLMYGEPGSGKSTTIYKLCKMITDRGGIALYPHSKSYITVNCIEMVRQVQKDIPIVVILEDFDEMTTYNDQLHDYLSLLDGENQVNNIVYLATTNYIEKIDKRFVDRPSRFDAIIKVDMPNENMRRQYIKSRLPDISEKDLSLWAKSSEGFSVAHLKELIISMLCLKKNFNETIAQISEMKKREYSNYEDFKKSKKMGFADGVRTSDRDEEDTRYNSTPEIDDDGKSPYFGGK